MDAKWYWESIHEENSAMDVSWYQATPRVSLEFIHQVNQDTSARVLDVGCGQAGVAAALLQEGYRRVSALDISGEAIRRAKDRLGASAREVDWIESNILDYVAGHPFDIWHDRAVLHFFTDAVDQRRYVESLTRNVASGGHVVIATFAPDGPEKCSGLPVLRHDAESVERILRPNFSLVESAREVHATPWGTTQAFQWALFKKGTEH